jgi:hypothetical protein
MWLHPNLKREKIQEASAAWLNRPKVPKVMVSQKLSMLSLNTTLINRPANRIPKEEEMQIYKELAASLNPDPEVQENIALFLLVSLSSFLLFHSKVAFAITPPSTSTV